LKTFSPLKIFLIIILLFFSLAGWASAAPDTRTLRVGVYENPPKIYTDKKGSVSGFWPTLTNHIARKEGWQIVWVPGTWAACLHNLTSGKIDLLPDTGWTPERARKYAFSKETVLLSWARLYTPKGKKIESILDLDGKTITGLAGSFDMNGPQGIKKQVVSFDLHCKFLEMPNYTKVFEALATGRANLALVDGYFGRRNASKYAAITTPIIIQPTRMLFAFPKNSPLTPYLIRHIDAGMKALKADKTSIYYQALDKYLETQAIEGVRIPGWVKYMMLILAGLLVLFVAVSMVFRIELRRRTRALRASEARLRLAFHTIPDSITISRLENGEYVTVNPAFEQITGYTFEEVKGKTASSISIWADRDDRRRLTEALKKTGKVANMETRFRMKDGRIVTALVSASIFSLSGGVPYILIISRPIDALKEAQRELEESLRELQQIHQLSLAIGGSRGVRQMAQETLSVVKAAVHPDMALFFVKEGERLQLIAQNTGDAAFDVSEADHHHLGECLCGLTAKTGTTIFSRDIFRDSRCTRNECKEAGIRSFAGLPLLAEGEVIGVIGLGARKERDFEARRVFLETLASEVAVGLRNALLLEELRQHEAHLERRVAERTAALEQANQELEAFSYSVSHDLHAPLRAIDGFSRILSEDYVKKLDDEAKRLIGVVRENTRRMGQLIDDLLRFSHISRQSIHPSEIDLANLAHSIFYEVTDEAQREKVEFIVQALPPAWGDAALIRQVFVNLLSNAVKFSATRKRPRIEVGYALEKGETVYYIKDNGVGFDMNYAHKLFQIFQRLHTREEFEGTGIGLSVVHRIITRHGGRVWAEAASGKGATFYLTLLARANGAP